MSAWLIILLAWLAAIIVFSLFWVVQKRTGDAGIVDVVWGASVGILSVAFCMAASGNIARRWIIAALAVFWSARLSWHLLQRVLKMSEDGRYVELKEAWGDQVDYRMFRFFQLQAFASVLFALPMLIAAWNESPLGWLDFFGVALWIFAISGEAIADSQLHRFRLDPHNKGKVCQNGLWHYSRHPNYFFEWLHWWSYVLLAITGQFGWLAIFAPLMMLFFILKVTGIPPTEKQAIKSRGDAYRRYQQTTSPFFPWFPRANSSIESNSATAP